MDDIIERNEQGAAVAASQRRQGLLSPVEPAVFFFVDIAHRSSPLFTAVSDAHAMTALRRIAHEHCRDGKPSTAWNNDTA